MPEGFLDLTRMGTLVRDLRKGVPLAEEPAERLPTRTRSGVAPASGAGLGATAVEHKRLVASRRPWEPFGPLLASAAWAMGLFAVPRRACLGDGAENNGTLWQERFSSFVPILDFIQALSDGYAAAHAGRVQRRAGRRYRAVDTVGWEGQVTEALGELPARQTALGEADGGGQGDACAGCGSQALTYLENNRSGCVTTSTGARAADHFELRGNAVQQFNQRVKGRKILDASKERRRSGNGAAIT